MTDRFLTPESLTSGRATPPPLFDLRVLERHLEDRLADMDAHVDRLLDLGGPSFLEAAAELDVLCAAIEEAQELLDETRDEMSRVLDRRAERRRTRRRWF